MKFKKIFIFIPLIILIFFIFDYFFKINSIDKLKSSLSADQKYKIKKILLPYKMIANQENTINSLNDEISRLNDLLDQDDNELKKIQKEISKLKIDKELAFKESNKEILLEKGNHKIMKDNRILNTYYFKNGLYSGIRDKLPGTGFLDFHNENLIILSSKGIIGYTNNIEKLKIQQIQNNIKDFIGINQFYKHNWFSIKDLLVFDDKIFISFTEEIKENCWNTSVIYAQINYVNINFEKLFTSSKCVHSINNKDKDFNASQSGGRMVNFDEDNILLTVGDYRSRFLAQEKDSINGKIIQINIKNSKHNVISMGHRNPQGLYFDKENKFIIETEHGPKGGDEINIIYLDDIKKNKIPNFGWPISSAGEHYGGKIEANEWKYKKYPLYKSHQKYGFVEPLISFVPSIAISEITKIDENLYAFTSLKAKSLYYFKLDKNNNLIDLEIVHPNQRIRDLKYKNKNLYLFLENVSAIGVISDYD